METAILAAIRKEIGTPTRATQGNLKELEWRRFEKAIAHYFRLIGFRAEIGKGSQDQGKDILLYRPQQPKPYGLVQCKVRNQKDVEIDIVQRTAGLVPTQYPDAKIVYVITTAGFTRPAQEIALKSPLNISLWSGDRLATEINKLPPANLATWLAEAFTGDFHTPTCPCCGQRMTVLPDDKYEYTWACTRTERCDRSLFMRGKDKKIISGMPRPAPPARAAKLAESTPTNPIRVEARLPIGLPVSAHRFEFPRIPPRLSPHSPSLLHRLALLPIIAVLVLLLAWKTGALAWAVSRVLPTALPHATPQALPVLARAIPQPTLSEHRHAAPQPVIPNAESIPAATPSLYRYQSPTRIFNLALEYRESPSEEQQKHAEIIVAKAVARIASEKPHPYLSIPTTPSIHHPRLYALMVFNMKTMQFVGPRVYLVSATLTPGKSVRIDGFETLYVGEGDW